VRGVTLSCSYHSHVYMCHKTSNKCWGPLLEHSPWSPGIHWRPQFIRTQASETPAFITVIYAGFVLVLLCVNSQLKKQGIISVSTKCFSNYSLVVPCVDLPWLVVTVHVHSKLLNVFLRPGIYMY